MIFLDVYMYRCMYIYMYDIRTHTHTLSLSLSFLDQLRRVLEVRRTAISLLEGAESEEKKGLRMILSAGLQNQGPTLMSLHKGSY